MLDYKEIKGNDNCFKCGNTLDWKSKIFNSRPIGISEVSTLGLTGEVIFLAKNEVEVIVKCPRCSNKNKFIKSL